VGFFFIFSLKRKRKVLGKRNKFKKGEKEEGGRINESTP
jgi:hypothetical protein